ncbi:ribonuclease H-like domain-containing protein [Tanacetum coccineum]
MSVHNYVHNTPHNFVHNTPHNSDDEDIHDPAVTLISKLNLSHPLHLHPNDFVALTVVSVKLKGIENYQVWSCVMLLAIKGKNKTGFIDGSCRRSNTDEVLGRQWDRVNAVVLGLHHKINTLNQNGSFIADYYHKLNALWKQFDALIELPRCTCHADDFMKHNQLMKLMQFLMGLDDSYMQIRSSIHSRETLPNVRSAYAIISSEESHKVAFGSLYGTSQRSQTSAFTVNAPNRGNFQSSSDGFFYEQMATLISLIKENYVNGKGVYSNMAGANQYMTYTNKNLVNVIDVSYLKIKVSRPNRTEAFITKIGNMPLTDYLTLCDVLVVLEYYVTLMSVHKVARYSILVIAFDEMHCYVLNQDLRAGKILGTGKQIGGLYYFDGNQGELVHLDLWGPYKVTSKDGFRSDNGTEFVNQLFNVFCESNGIIHQTSCSYTPQQNGIVERKHRHLLNVARSLLFQGWILLNMWTECISTATYLINILSTSVLNGKSPYDLVYNKPPSLNHLRSFSCLAYATILNSHDKFGSRSEKCVLVGYSNFKKGSPSATSNGNDGGHFQGANASASENGGFAAYEENNDNSKGNVLHDHSQEEVNQANNDVQNLRRSSRNSVFPKNFNDFAVDPKVKHGLEKYVNCSHLSKGDYCFTNMLNK